MDYSVCEQDPRSNCSRFHEEKMETESLLFNKIQGYFITSKKLSTEQMEELKVLWKSLYSGFNYPIVAIRIEPVVKKSKYRMLRCK